MSRLPAKASSFLAKLNLADELPKTEPPATALPSAEQSATPVPTGKRKPADAGTAKKGRPAKRPGVSRKDLKHIGGYVDAETDEQFALLKIRLKKGNDELITLAIDSLFRSHKGKRAFGD